MKYKLIKAIVLMAILFVDLSKIHAAPKLDNKPERLELLQLPGRGELDFVPIISTLKQINDPCWTEVYKHPVPRGIPILTTAT